MAPFAVQAAEDVRTCANCGQRVRAKKTFGGFVCPLCGHKMGGGHESKEGARMAPQSSDVARLLTEAASAPTFDEQQRLVGAAEQARSEIAATAAHERDVDLANATVGERLTPVRVHEHHTAATDWLGGVETTAVPEAEREMVAQGSVWYSQRPEMVKQHPDELAQQALGMAQRLAGKFGSGADAAERAFLDHVGMLHSRDVAQGLVVVAASQEPGVQGPQTTMGLPGDLTSSERAPAMRDLENNTAGGSVSDTEWPDPLVLPQQDVDAANGDSGTQRVAINAPLQSQDAGTGYSPPPRQNRVQHLNPGAGGQHTYTVYARTQAGVGRGQSVFHYSSDDPEAHWEAESHALTAHSRAWRVHPDQVETKVTRTGDEPRNQIGGRGDRYSSRKDQSMPQQHTAACPECSGCQACGGTHRVAVRAPRTAASGLDQIDQTIDSHDNPKATAYPTDVAFPWEMPNDSGQAINETEQQLAEREQRKGASLRQIAERAAHDAAQVAYRRIMGGYDASGWAGDMGAGGVRPGMQDAGNPGNTYPGNLADSDPVYGDGGDNGNQPLKPYGADEADDYTNNPGMNIQPGAPMQYDQAGRPNQVGQPTARRRSDNDPQIAQALAFVRQRRELVDGQR